MDGKGARQADQKLRCTITFDESCTLILFLSLYFCLLFRQGCLICSKIHKVTTFSRSLQHTSRVCQARYNNCQIYSVSMGVVEPGLHALELLFCYSKWLRITSFLSLSQKIRPGGFSLFVFELAWLALLASISFLYALVLIKQRALTVATLT